MKIISDYGKFDKFKSLLEVSVSVRGNTPAPVDHL